MRKTHKNNSSRYFRFIFVLLLYSAFHQSVAVAQDYQYSYECAYEYDEPTNYEEYGEFAEILKVFEDEIALQEEVDESESVEKGVFSKWTKKLKRWFLKRTKKVLKKCLKLTHCSNPEECAYTAAKFKRKVDKVRNTGNIENILSEFGKGIPKGKNIASFEHFKDRVRFYHKHKHAKPSKYIAKGGVRDDLNDIPTGALIGGVEVFCGTLISVLPFPGCCWLGRAMILDGGSRIVTAYSDKYDNDHQTGQLPTARGCRLVSSFCTETFGNATSSVPTLRRVVDCTLLHRRQAQWRDTHTVGIPDYREQLVSGFPLSQKGCQPRS